MAGDWIKYDVSTSDKPEVWEIATALDIDPDAVVGKLLRVWAWFDSQTENGNAPSVTKALLDRRVGVTGFVNAMIAAGWMSESDGDISVPNFDRHNGQTAKKRCLTAKRVASHKSRNAKGNAKTNSLSVSDALPREEKRREEKKKDLSSEATAPDLPKYSPDDYRFAEGMLKAVLRVAPKTKPPNLAKWAETIRLMRERDGLSHSEIADVFRFANQDDFWKTNILSPAKLREQFAKLDAKMRNPHEKRLSTSADRWAIDHDDTSWLTGAYGPGDCLDGELDIPPDADNLHRLEAGRGGRH